MKLETAKGVRDFPPEEKILRQKIIEILKEVFEKYGYNPLETHLIERLETLSAKFAAGESSDEYWKGESCGRNLVPLAPTRR